MALKISHAGAAADDMPVRPITPARTPEHKERIVSAPQREKYIAPPRRGRR